jgi:hypothetical protein
MYWWNVSSLADDLKEGRIDDKERFRYFLATFLAWSIAVPLYAYFSSPFEAVHLFSVIPNLLFACIGITTCYEFNRRGDNSDFIGRMICLGWPSAIRTIALWLAVLSIFLVAVSPLSRETTLTEAFGKLLRGWLWPEIMIYFSIVLRHVTYIAQPKDSETALQKRQVQLMAKLELGLLATGLGSLMVWVVVTSLGWQGPAPVFSGIALVLGLVWLMLRRVSKLETEPLPQAK